MLTQELAKQVDEYLATTYSLTSQDMKNLEEADNMIMDFTINGVGPKDSEAIQRMTDELYESMKNIFMDNCGVTPRLLQYQERYYQLLVYFAKANKLEGMYLDSLALLCFTSSWDLYYLKELKYKGDKTQKDDNQKDIASTI